MIAYASWTGTKSTLAALRAANWRLLLSAAGHHGNWDPGGFPYALDNGAWSAFQQKKPFDEEAFGRALARWADAADWVVAPDIVAGGLPSLEMSLRWLPRCLDACPRC